VQILGFGPSCGALWIHSHREHRVHREIYSPSGSGKWIALRLHTHIMLEKRPRTSAQYCTNARKATTGVTSAQSVPEEACPKFELLLIVRLDRNLVFQAIEKDEVATILERPLVVRLSLNDLESEVESDG
jgi:hypothetical protein